MDAVLHDFLSEAAESLDTVEADLVRFERQPQDVQLLAGILRAVHSIKGTGGFLGLSRLEALAHAAETLLAGYRDGRPVTAQGVSCVLAGVDRIRDILSGLARSGREPAGCDRTLIADLQRLAQEEAASPAAVPCLAGASAAVRPRGEGSAQTAPSGADRTMQIDVETVEQLAVLSAALDQARDQIAALATDAPPGPLQAAMDSLTQVSQELQRCIMRTRLQPVGAAWQKLPRMVRDLARRLGKAIELRLEGADTPLDRQIVDLLRDPLVHLVRNAADHGIEDAAARRASGKAEAGSILIQARLEDGHAVVTVSDDGGGLDGQRIGRRAVRLGLVSEAELAWLDERRLHGLIFHPGFSTADEVTPVSGRGVGLDVVKANIERVGGCVEVRSEPGHGTSFTLRVPLSLAGTGAETAAIANAELALAAAATQKPIPAAIAALVPDRSVRAGAGPVRSQRKGAGRVLLVDDNAFFRRLLASHLERAGYRVTAASSAAQALALAQERFEAVVCDLDMLRMDGIALAEAIGADGKGKDVPVILLSSQYEEAVVTRACRAGIADIVGKFDRHGLIASLRACAGRYGLAA